MHQYFDSKTACNNDGLNICLGHFKRHRQYSVIAVRSIATKGANKDLKGGDVLLCIFVSLFGISLNDFNNIMLKRWIKKEGLWNTLEADIERRSRFDDRDGVHVEKNLKHLINLKAWN